MPSPVAMPAGNSWPADIVLADDPPKAHGEILVIGSPRLPWGLRIDVPRAAGDGGWSQRRAGLAARVPVLEATIDRAAGTVRLPPTRIIATTRALARVTGCGEVPATLNKTPPTPSSIFRHMSLVTPSASELLPDRNSSPQDRIARLIGVTFSLTSRIASAKAVRIAGRSTPSRRKNRPNDGSTTWGDTLSR